MIYRNSKTGAVIDSPCVISGGDWEQEPEKETARSPKSKDEKIEEEAE